MKIIFTETNGFKELEPFSLYIYVRVSDTLAHILGYDKIFLMNKSKEPHYRTPGWFKGKILLKPKEAKIKNRFLAKIFGASFKWRKQQ